MASSQPVEYTLYTGNFHMNTQLQAAVDILAINSVQDNLSKCNM